MTNEEKLDFIVNNVLTDSQLDITYPNGDVIRFAENFGEDEKPKLEKQQSVEFIFKLQDVLNDTMLELWSGKIDFKQWHNTALDNAKKMVNILERT